MRMSPCGCGVTFLVRLNRALWMRLLPGRRHYFCIRCSSHQLLSRHGLRRLFPGLLPELDRDVTAPAPLEGLEPGLPGRWPGGQASSAQRPARPHPRARS